MTTLLSHDAFHDSVGHAFNELMLLQQLSALPEEHVLRVLQSIPPALLRQALAAGGKAADQPSPAPAPEERRVSTRHEVQRSARLILNGRRNGLDVQLRDISEDGCRIRTPNAALLPVRFGILIEGMAGEIACELRWRSGSEAGIRFLTG